MQKLTLSEELTWRGFVNQTTYKDITALDKTSLTFYFGVDPSAASMTIGNLAAAMMVRHFIDHGHKAILLVGGATGMIGDPKDDEERTLKSLDEIAKNKAAIADQYRRIFAGQPFEVVDNYDWFKDLGYLQFLREIGKHMSMTQLLDREFVQSRIGQGGSGLSYAEFSYSLIQGYDFLHLFREHDATLQLAGADQWGNSIAGVELIRKLEGKEAHVWTGPLVINTATGKKFGKSEGGAVWLNADMTSVFDFYQFWLNVDDAGVETYLKFYTLLPKDELDNLMREFKAAPEQRAAQKRLAFEVTALVHGQAAAEQARDATAALSRGEGSATLPTVTVPLGEQNTAKLLVDAELAPSLSHAQRLIAQGGVKLNRQKVMGATITLHNGDILQVGKRNFVRILGL
ncbi:MAG TPA: tyrosine--tRNA ligase [Candidatus Acidoferrum sp.]|nr:tyrosine--tRNA ligase [Candidatus Acidoferrum sp.]